MGISRGQTPNQKAYNKEVRRLTNAIKRGEKQGLIFPEDMLPEMPKRVTQKRVQELKKIKPKDLYLRATNFGTVYSETTTNKQRVSIQEEPKKSRTTKTTQVEPKKVRVKITNEAEQRAKKNLQRAKKAGVNKKTLSAEEKHLRNVQRGRKAWESRVKNVGGYGSEGYQKMINKMVSHLHPKTVTKEEVESTEDLDFPTYNIVEELGYTILGLKRKAYPFHLPIEVRKNTLYGLLLETAGDYEDTDDLPIYCKYLDTNIDNLDLEFGIIEYHSSQEKVEESFVNAGAIITQGALTPSQAEQFSTEVEYGW